MLDRNILDKTGFNRRDLLFISALLLLSAVTFCLHPFARGLWVMDEARYGEALRSMMETGRFFTPTLNGEIYSDKPPLFFWYLMLFARITGSITPAVLLIATSTTAIACVVAVYFLGRLLFDRETAFIACIVMVTSFLYLGIAQFVRMDLLMLFFMLLALYFFCKGYMTGRCNLYYLIYVFLSLSVLTKGPLGYIIIMTSVIAYLIHARDAKEIFRLKLVQGTGIVLAITGIWILLTIRETGTDYIAAVWNRQLMGRFVNSWIHERKVHYYLMWLPITFVPWVAYVPRGFMRMWQDRDGCGKLIVWWTICATVILSAISYKIFIYILLFIPALSLMAGSVLRGLFNNHDVRSRFRAEHIITACLLLVIGFAAAVPLLLLRMEFPSFIVERLHKDHLAYLDMASSFYIISIICAAAAVVVLIFGILRRHKIVFVSLVIMMMALSNILAGFLVPKFDDEMSPRRFCEGIRKYTTSGFEAATYKIDLGILNYYTRTNMKRLSIVEQAEEFLDENPRAVIVMTGVHWDLNRERLQTVEAVDEAFISGRSSERTYILLAQDGKKLESIADYMLKYRERGFVLARYKNGLTILRHYIGEDVLELERRKDLQEFLKKHNKTAVLVDDYWLKKNKRGFKDMMNARSIIFAGKTYNLLIRQPGE